MVPNSELLFGPPGTGKTYTLIEEVQNALQSGIAPDRIGYVSFTKKAISEALDRACEQFNLDPKDLPWFRTLHSWGYHGIGASTTDMMGASDWAIMRDACGMNFSGRSSANPDEGILLSSSAMASGDKYITLLDKARYRMIPYIQEYNESEARELSPGILQRIDKELSLYKAKNHKIDFVDQIELYIQSGIPPHLDLLIIDEAQDLTPLQWEMVKKIAPYAERVLIAGDDDQAIHRWAGVDLDHFLNASSNIRVLGQSYRMPSSVHRLSQKIVRRISKRQEKEFLPTSEEGRISYHTSLDGIDFRQGSWTVMARTNQMVQEFSTALKEHGHLLSVRGKSSIDQESAEALKTWRRLCAGEGVELGLVRKFYDHVRKQGDGAVVKRGSKSLLDSVSPDAYLTYERLVAEFNMLAEKHWDPYEVARFGDHDRRYIESLERRGEDITSTPRIKVSTFHRMKGGEDDNCVVYTGQPQKANEWKNKFPDDEHRAFYVGVTRTKKNLHIIQGRPGASYDI